MIMELLLHLVFLVGVIKLISCSCYVIDYLIQHCYEPLVGGHDLMKRYDGKGSWALITGSSDGLGKGYAMDLASRGFNIVIVARSPQKMQKVADEIKKEHKDV